MSKDLNDYYIYRITYLVDGRTYIGKRQIRYWDDYYGSGSHIKNAVNKYGKENFKREILAEYHNISNEESCIIESKYIESEWESGHGEFNYSLKSHGGNIFEGMPDDIKHDIISRKMETDKANHGGVQAWSTHESRLKAMKTYINNHGSMTAHMNNQKCIDKANKTKRDRGVLDHVADRLNTPEAREKSRASLLNKYNGDIMGMCRTKEARAKVSAKMKANHSADRINTPEVRAKINEITTRKYNWYYNEELVYTGITRAANRIMNRLDQKWVRGSRVD